MAGNKRFLNDDFPNLSRVAEKRKALQEGQAPFVVILSCSDSRVIPNLIFVQNIGDLFVARVAGNYPDDLVAASIEYAVEHLGSRLIMVLGHQGCGAVQAVYSAIQTKQPLPTHLSTIERLITPGIASVVQSRGGAKEACPSQRACRGFGAQDDAARPLQGRRNGAPADRRRLLSPRNGRRNAPRIDGSV